MTLLSNNLPIQSAQLMKKCQPLQALQLPQADDQDPRKEKAKEERKAQTEPKERREKANLKEQNAILLDKKVHVEDKDQIGSHGE